MYLQVILLKQYCFQPGFAKILSGSGFEVTPPPSKYSEYSEFILLVKGRGRYLPVTWGQGYYILLFWDVPEAKQRVIEDAIKGLEHESKPSLQDPLSRTQQRIMGRLNRRKPQCLEGKPKGEGGLEDKAQTQSSRALGCLLPESGG